MNQHLELENAVVLAGVQALIGAITPSMSAIAVEVDAERATAVLHVALKHPADDATASLLEDIADDINQYAEDAVAVTVRPWVGEDWTRGWPGRERRMLYAELSA